MSLQARASSNRPTAGHRLKRHTAVFLSVPETRQTKCPPVYRRTPCLIYGLVFVLCITYRNSLLSSTERIYIYSEALTAVGARFWGGRIVVYCFLAISAYNASSPRCLLHLLIGQFFLFDFFGLVAHGCKLPSFLVRIFPCFGHTSVYLLKLRKC